jgi:hypothetical protein
MPGDKIQIGTKAFYKSTAAHTSSSTTQQMLSALLSVLNSGAGNLLSNGHANTAGASSPTSANLNPSLLDQLKQANPNQIQ